MFLLQPPWCPPPWVELSGASVKRCPTFRQLLHPLSQTRKIQQQPRWWLPQQLQAPPLVAHSHSMPWRAKLPVRQFPPPQLLRTRSATMVCTAQLGASPPRPRPQYRLITVRWYPHPCRQQVRSLMQLYSLQNVPLNLVKSVFFGHISTKTSKPRLVANSGTKRYVVL